MFAHTRMKILHWDAAVSRICSEFISKPVGNVFSQWGKAEIIGIIR